MYYGVGGAEVGAGAFLILKGYNMDSYFLLRAGLHPLLDEEEVFVPVLSTLTEGWGSFSDHDLLKFFYVLEYLNSEFKRQYRSISEIPDHYVPLSHTVGQELNTITVYILEHLERRFRMWLDGFLITGIKIFYSMYAYYREDGVHYINATSDRLEVLSWDAFFKEFPRLRKRFEKYGVYGIRRFIAQEGANRGVITMVFRPRSRERVEVEGDRLSEYLWKFTGVSSLTIEDIVTDNKLFKNLLKAASHALNITKKSVKDIRKYYKEYLHSKNFKALDGGERIATISILLNMAHNNGKMADYALGVGQGEGAVHLQNFTELGSRIPEGVSLVKIYKQWRTI